MTTTLRRRCPVERLLNSKEVADILGLHFREVYKLRKSGELPAVAFGGAYRFDPTDVRKLINDHKESSTHA